MPAAPFGPQQRWLPVVAQRWSAKAGIRIKRESSEGQKVWWLIFFCACNMFMYIYIYCCLIQYIYLYVIYIYIFFLNRINIYIIYIYTGILLNDERILYQHVCFYLQKLFICMLSARPFSLFWGLGGRRTDAHGSCYGTVFLFAH